MQNNLSIERSKQEQSAQTTKIKPKWHMTVLHVVYYLIMIAFLVFYMLPFWGTVMTSFKSNSEVMTTTPITPPSEWTMEGYYKNAWLGANFSKYFANSLMLSVGTVILSIIMTTSTAYVVGKFVHPVVKGVEVFYSVFMMVPQVLLLIPLLQTINALDLYDNLWGLVLVHAVFGMPMCTVMMRGYYADVPDALIRQAMIDGNGVWQIYRKIVLPNTKIATITVFVFQCTSIWNEMLFALVLGGYDSKPATIALNELAGTMAAEFNVQMAGSLILALPVLVLYIFMGKYLISGQMSGAVTAS